MGIGILKKLLTEAKSSSDVITLEATVITGFEFQALEECKQKCKPLNITRSKGRIFFNIMKDSYPEVLKMRSIDNVFLVSEAFEELKLKNVKDEDLVTIKNLAEQVDWENSVPKWAEIVGFKGIQFPKCANKDRSEPLDSGEPLCQNCQKANSTEEDGKVENGVTHDELHTPSKEWESPKINLIACEEEAFQTPPDNCIQLECKRPEICHEEDSEPHNDLPDGAKPLSAQDTGDSALESSPEANLLAVKPTDDTDDDAFHSAEEELQLEEPIKKVAPPSEEKQAETSGPGSDVKSAENLAFDLATATTPPVASVSTGEVKSEDGSDIEPVIHGSQVATGADHKISEAKYQKNKSKWQRRKEERKKKLLSAESGSDKSSDASKDPERSSVCSDESDINSQNKAALAEGLVIGSTESIDPSSDTLSNTTDQSKPREKKKNYWQKRREAKAKKAAETEAKKPPRKAYVDDGIMKFRVTCYRNGPKHSFESNDAAGHFGGLINDKLHWNVDLTRHDINVVLVIEGDSAYVSMALTRQSFHRRNIKNFGPTTLRATLCYGLLQLAEPRVGDIIMDPMCGGGSISIEGAWALPGTYNICGDVNGKCMERVVDNIAFNSKTTPLLVEGLQWSVRRLPLRDQSIDVLVTDLPFGLRVGKQKDNTGLYIAVLTETARVVRTVGRASLLTYDKMAMTRALQRTRHLWREINCKMVNQGGLRCFAYLLLRRNTDPQPTMTVQAPQRQPAQEHPSHSLQTGEETELPPEQSLQMPQQKAADELAQSDMENIENSQPDSTTGEASQLLDTDLQNPTIPEADDLDLDPQDPTIPEADGDLQGPTIPKADDLDLNLQDPVIPKADELLAESPDSQLSPEDTKSCL